MTTVFHPLLLSPKNVHYFHSNILYFMSKKRIVFLLIMINFLLSIIYPTSYILLYLLLLLCMSTQRTMQWFEERGFELCDPSLLPASRPYNASRGSKVYMKPLGSQRDVDAEELLWNVWGVRGKDKKVTGISWERLARWEGEDQEVNKGGVGSSHIIENMIKHIRTRTR